VLLFVTLSIPLMTKQFVGDPIQCFTPTYFTEAQTKYVNSYCWTTSTYYLVEDLAKFGTVHLAEHDGFPEVPTDSVGDGQKRSRGKSKVRVSYYQWTVTILIFQGKKRLRIKNYIPNVLASWFKLEIDLEYVY
jgi:hypothetical protein